MAEEILHACVTCALKHRFCDGYTDLYLRLGNHKSLFTQCIRKMVQNNASCTHYAVCAKLLKEQCALSKHIVLKTILTPMAVLGNILKAVPYLKVIHLVRDARATLKSQGAFTKDTSYHFCNRIFQDIKSRMELEKVYSNRILQVRYEDIAMDPLKMAQRIYEFAELELSDEISSRVWNMTHSEEVCKGFRCTKRHNSTETMLRWRKHISFAFVQTVDESCKTVYDHFGYLPAESEEKLRDLSHPLITTD